MSAVRKHAVVEQDGELIIRDLPYKKGDRVQVIVLGEEHSAEHKGMTAAELIQSPLIGLWADRTDIVDSSKFARALREKSQRREDRA